MLSSNPHFFFLCGLELPIAFILYSPIGWKICIKAYLGIAFFVLLGNRSQLVHSSRRKVVLSSCYIPRTFEGTGEAQDTICALKDRVRVQSTRTRNYGQTINS